jgi:anthranilate synthase/aminodeoxychorismate synthase-like glutamine amidotransferase
MILLIDNYDSFTYNLYHYLGELGAEVRVFRNDAITLREIASLRPEKIVISPGPCTPREAGISCEVIRRFGRETPILGVCLGHQCIGTAFGGEIIRTRTIMHGKLSEVFHDSKTIYQSLKNPFPAMRYHSLVINPARLPSDLTVSAQTSDKIIMGVRHRSFPIEGVQFHPESILTEEGKKLLKNFLEYY